MKNNSIPTLKQCYDLIDKYEMLPNIIEHSKQVMNVALAITDHLEEGTAVNRDIVLAGALLHDISKTRSLKTGEPHDILGARMLTDLGYPILADIIEEHVYLKKFDPHSPINEKEIVNYADKRVMHDKIVSLEERTADLVKRYGTSPERVDYISKNALTYFQIEKKINNHMKIKINEAIGKIETGESQ